MYDRFFVTHCYLDSPLICKKLAFLKDGIPKIFVQSQEKSWQNHKRKTSPKKWKKYTGGLLLNHPKNCTQQELRTLSFT